EDRARSGKSRRRSMGVGRREDHEDQIREISVLLELGELAQENVGANLVGDAQLVARVGWRQNVAQARDARASADLDPAGALSPVVVELRPGSCGGRNGDEAKLTVVADRLPEAPG